MIIRECEEKMCLTLMSSLQPETDRFQNLLRAKDGGKDAWYFESPPDWFAGDKSLAYNGTLTVILQAISWMGTFVNDHDVVLVSSKPRLSLAMQGLRRDGETTRTYSIPLHEKAGWIKFKPSPKYSGQSNVTAQDFIRCLNSLVGVRVRGGYYEGKEETQLRSVSIVQGQMAGDEQLPAASSAGVPSHIAAHSCQSPHRFEIVFNNPGLPCHKWEEMSSGLLQAADPTSPHTTYKLDPSSSSPLHDYYIGRRLQITGGPGEGSFGTVQHSIGKLNWEVVSRGVTSVHIANAGSNCLSDGRLAAVGGGGHGFDAEFKIKSTIPAVLPVAFCARSMRMPEH